MQLWKKFFIGGLMLLDFLCIYFYTYADEKNIIISNSNNVDLQEKNSLLDSKAEGTAGVITYKSIHNVDFPLNIRAYIDSEHILGNNDIFSDEYEVINYGSNSVLVKISNIKVICKIDKSDDVETKKNNFLEGNFDIKMIWNNKGIYIKKVLPVKEGKSNEYVIYLAPFKDNDTFENKCLFNFEGTIKDESSYSGEEFIIDFDYCIINADVPFIEDDVNTFIDENSIEETINFSTHLKEE